MQIICAECSKPFHAKPSQRRTYCSRTCYGKGSVGPRLRARYLERAADPQAILDARTDKSGDCWLWTGCKWANGYGRVVILKRDHVASRLAWELANGRKLADGEFVCHTCDIPLCVRPSHLFVGSPADNSADMTSKARQARGTRCHTAKLQEADVLEIRRMYAANEGGCTTIAAKYGMNHSTINDLLRGRTWKHVA
jgi:hypothetical protein